MRREYINSPIEEAICEFRMSPETDWDLAVPGLYYDRIREELPTREQRRVRSVELVMGTEGLMEELLVQDRMFFFTPDRSIGIQIGPKFLGVNVLKPYPSWQRFRPRIEHALRILTETVNVKGIYGMSLRYINLVQAPGLDVDPEEYFEFLPRFGTGFPVHADSFMVGAELPFFDGQDACRIEVSDGIPSMPDSTAFLLNIEYFLAEPESVPIDSAMDWLDRAHAKTIELFEASITDKARELFGIAAEPETAAGEAA
ncbi:MAG: TIGR04255 family protein [Methanomicrobiales archaeon]|nr:TIGR04255 family protein [Methanomicrobiales archaeon]MDI6876896.1 TIGR04255 family protein [Methanomicrobiales archaeon]